MVPKRKKNSATIHAKMNSMGIKSSRKSNKAHIQKLESMLFEGKVVGKERKKVVGKLKTHYVSSLDAIQRSKEAIYKRYGIENEVSFEVAEAIIKKNFKGRDDSIAITNLRILRVASEAAWEKFNQVENA